MKPVLFSNQKFLFVFPISVLLISGCATVRENASPWSTGLGFATMPGWSISDRMSVHVLASDMRVNFTGGKNYFLQLGPQLRWSLSNKPPNGWWGGVEAAYLSITTKYDNAPGKPKATGFTVGPVGGYRFQLGTLPLSVYVAPSFLHRSEFKLNGMSSGTSRNAFFGKLGFDIHFMSLLSRKGR